MLTNHVLSHIMKSLKPHLFGRYSVKMMTSASTPTGDGHLRTRAQWQL